MARFLLIVFGLIVVIIGVEVAFLIHSGLQPKSSNNYQALTSSKEFKNTIKNGTAFENKTITIVSESPNIVVVGYNQQGISTLLDQEKFNQSGTIITVKPQSGATTNIKSSDIKQITIQLAIAAIPGYYETFNQSTGELTFVLLGKQQYVDSYPSTQLSMYYNNILALAVADATAANATHVDSQTLLQSIQTVQTMQLKNTKTE